MNKTFSWLVVGLGVQRRILNYTNQIMMVEVKFEKGAKGDPHSHPHTQATYVLSGEFSFTIGDKVVVIKKGETCTMEPEVIHSCICLKEGVLLDVFTPFREDFLL